MKMDREIGHMSCKKESVTTTGPTLEDLSREMLLRIGEDPEREGLVDTPKRFAKAMEFLTSGYQSSFHEVVGSALFEHTGDDIVAVTDIGFYSLCEHHVLPFFGKASVAYIPNGKVIGLSKIPRLINHISRKLQVQERLNQEVALALEEILRPEGVVVRMEASHMCMMMRGVEKQGSTTITQAIRGKFKTDPLLRREALSLVGLR